MKFRHHWAEHHLIIIIIIIIITIHSQDILKGELFLWKDIFFVLFFNVAISRQTENEEEGELYIFLSYKIWKRMVRVTLYFVLRERERGRETCL